MGLVLIFCAGDYGDLFEQDQIDQSKDAMGTTTPLEQWAPLEEVNINEWCEHDNCDEEAESLRSACAFMAELSPAVTTTKVFRQAVAVANQQGMPTMAHFVGQGGGAEWPRHLAVMAMLVLTRANGLPLIDAKR